jgi:hypothetical protein
MAHERTFSSPLDALLIIGGPAALGAAIGLRSGAARLAGEAAAMPLLLVGLTLMMLPALYIGAALFDVAPPAPRLFRAAGRALRSHGVLLLGVAPAAAFVVVTANVHEAAPAIGAVAFAASAGISLRTLHREAFAGTTPRRGRYVALFIAWVAVLVTLEAHVLLRAFARFN